MVLSRYGKVEAAVEYAKAVMSDPALRYDTQARIKLGMAVAHKLVEEMHPGKDIKAAEILAIVQAFGMLIALPVSENGQLIYPCGTGLWGPRAIRAFILMLDAIEGIFYVEAQQCNYYRSMDGTARLVEGEWFGTNFVTSDGTLTEGFMVNAKGRWKIVSASSYNTSRYMIRLEKADED
jgi:hypothetical protein